jgi:hypothetical protein
MRVKEKVRVRDWVRCNRGRKTKEKGGAAQNSLPTLEMAPPPPALAIDDDDPYHGIVSDRKRNPAVLVGGFLWRCVCVDGDAHFQRPRVSR